MKDNIKKVIIEWQEGRAAQIRKRALELVYTEEINAVIGLRRSGKTYFIFSQIENLLKNGLKPNVFMYINFDDERLAELKGSELGIIMEAYFELYPENRDREIRGIISALKTFGLTRGIIITNSDEEEISESSYSISVIPYWKWMLSPTVPPAS